MYIFPFIDQEIWSNLSVSALPAEEKEKLYKAIDYNESVRVKYPTEVRTCMVMGFSVVALPLNDKLSLSKAQTSRKELRHWNGSLCLDVDSVIVIVITYYH